MWTTEVGNLNCLPTEILAHWFLLYIVGVTSSKHQREVTVSSLALSVGEPLHEQSFPITVFNSFFITFSVFRYLKIRTIGHIGNFFLVFFYPLLQGGKRWGKKTGSKRVSNGCQVGSLDGLQNGSQLGIESGH